MIGYAQSTFGDIRGTTRDPAGLALPQAVVTLHNLDDNTTRSAVTDDNGSFLFENLKPGQLYSVGLQGRIFHIVHRRAGIGCPAKRARRLAAIP